MRTCLPHGRGVLLAMVIVLMTPPAAWACGMCAWAQLWYVFPAIIAWMIISACWLIAQFALDWKFQPRRRSKVKLWVFAIAVPLSVVLSGAVGIGPLLTAWMIVPPAIAFSKIISNKVQGAPLYKRLSVGLGGLAILALCVTLFTEGRRAGAMTQADVLEMWRGTILERQIFTRLKLGEPASLEEYRKILKKKPFGTVYGQVALRIAAIGEPVQDSKLLLDSLEKLDAVSVSKMPSYEKSYYREELEKALAQLSKVDLPQGTAVKIWKAKINQSPEK